MNPGIAILVGAVVMLLAMGVWALVKGLRWAFPKGRSVQKEYRGVKLTLICSPDAERALKEDMNDVARQCARAAWALRSVWDGLPSSLDWVVVQLLTNEEFDGTGRDAELRSKWAAVLLLVHKMIGSATLPMPTTRVAHVDLIRRKGQPIIHELIHYCLHEEGRTYDYTHDLPVWAGAGREGFVPMEVRAEEAYAADVEGNSAPEEL
jgi:hypothetical protein